MAGFSSTNHGKALPQNSFLLLVWCKVLVSVNFLPGFSKSYFEIGCQLHQDVEETDSFEDTDGNTHHIRTQNLLSTDAILVLFLKM